MAERTGFRCRARFTSRKAQRITADAPFESRKRPAAAVGVANAKVTESSPQKGPGTWQRDLTSEGVEPNPGPSKKARRRSKAKRALPTLLVWQLNLAAFALRGWDLLAAAEASRVDVVAMQETRMTCEEAMRVNNSLQRCTMFHQQEVPQQQRAQPKAVWQWRSDEGFLPSRARRTVATRVSGCVWPSQGST